MRRIQEGETRVLVESNGELGPYRTIILWDFHTMLGLEEPVYTLASVAPGGCKSAMCIRPTMHREIASLGWIEATWGVKRSHVSLNRDAPLRSTIPRGTFSVQQDIAKSKLPSAQNTYCSAPPGFCPRHRKRSMLPLEPPRRARSSLRRLCKWAVVCFGMPCSPLRSERSMNEADADLTWAPITSSARKGLYLL